MAEVAKVAARRLPAFKLGKKPVFLPEHVITMVRKEHLPPNEACFHVPLTFTKFDLRDYLWNLYDVEVTKVRSFVKETPLTQRPGTRSWYRPQPRKIMTVELAQPFQWPDLPANQEPWSKELFDLREKRQEDMSEQQATQQRMEIPLKSKTPKSEDRKKLADLAKRMLAGEVKWTNDVPLDPKWDKLLKDLGQKDGVDENAVVEEAEHNGQTRP